jgi:serine/threonine protein kinase
MPSVRLQCSCGHSWDYPNPDAVPDDVRSVCPVCTAGVQATPGIKAASHPTAKDPGPGGPELKPGDELAGFEIIRLLNRGGMGVVYKAKQRGLDRLVALKVVAPERLTGKDHAEYLERFRREARAAALLNHPNIVTVYATDLDGPRPYFAMEFVEGIDLYRLVRQAGPLAVLDSTEYVRQSALGLQHAYEKGLTHRDIKPHNLMVTPSPLTAASASSSGSRRAPLVKILDMGLARLEGPEAGLEEGLTVADAILGTPDFLAPEQAEDSRNVDVRADLYSLGATWFFVLVGEVPFPGTSLMQKLRKQLTQPTPVVSEHRADVPPVVVALIRKLMDRDPAKRFQTPAELADAIAEFQRDPSAIPDWMGDAEGPKFVDAHPGGVTALGLNGDGRLLLTGGDDQRLRVWDTRTLVEGRELTGDAGPVSAVAVTFTGKWGASCALRLMPQDMAVQLWDLAAGVERRRLGGPRDSLVSVALSFDGRRVAAGARDGMVHVWTLDPPNTPRRVMTGHAGTVTGVAFVPDDTAVLSVGLDGTLYVWDLATGKGERVLMGDAGAIRAVACSRKTGCVAVAGDRLVLVAPDGPDRTLAGHEGGTLCVAFSGDGAFLASGGRDQMVRIWRTADGTEAAVFDGHVGPVRAVGVSPDRRFIYSGGADGTIRRWPVRLIATAISAGASSKSVKK